MRKMEYTPNVDPVSCKGQHSYDDCCDSGYSGLFHSPQSISGGDLCRSLSSVELPEMPKENLRHSVKHKVSNRNLHKFPDRDSRGVQQPSTVTWCETPKVYKRDASLRHRLPMCKPNMDGKNDSTRSPCTRMTEASISTKSEHWSSASFDSLDTMMGAFASSTLSVDEDLPLSSRKRRFFFSQMRTSTLEDGKLPSGRPSNFGRGVLVSDVDFSRHISGCDGVETPQSRKFLPVLIKENSPSPVSLITTDINDVFSTPSSSHTPKCVRSICEDSGFGSLALDKSQDSSVDHDGSFQELLLPASKTNSETPNLAENKRRSRLQRQKRLSTLKEGSSQSEDEPSDRKNERFNQRQSCSKDVFIDEATPRRALSKCGNGMASGSALAKQDYATPLRTTQTKLECTTPLNTASANSDITPVRTTPVNLSLTPALQLVHAMAQQKAQIFAGQSQSLKEQLEFAGALAETPLSCRTAMPLAGLIGRKMGLGKVDILTELKKRNLRHILGVILGHLTSESIVICSLVCKSWNEIIQQDKRAATRRRSHLSDVTSSHELSGTPHCPDADTRLTLLKRSALKMVQAQSRRSSFCTPQSEGSSSAPSLDRTPHSGSKHDKFIEIAKTLFSDEWLKPCPRCQHPAKCHSVKGEGVCSRDDCGFQFCTSCLCTFHGSRECGSRSGSRRKSDKHLPGSAQSWRNIRRL